MFVGLRCCFCCACLPGYCLWLLCVSCCCVCVCLRVFELLVCDRGLSMVFVVLLFPEMFGFVVGVGLLSCL